VDGSISGQIEWTSLNSIHQIVGSKTGTGITFAETAYIKRGGAVLNCRYYLNSEVILLREHGIVVMMEIMGLSQ
jgi:hypothetical protein